MVPDDRDFRAADVQLLASRDAVAAFFATLGYNTDARTPQTAAAMGITAESLQHQIRHIERIADHEHGSLQVYLVELTSVTVAATQALARALKNRAGNYLLVLTSDYDEIDFVLVERILPTSPGSGIATRQVAVRPRILTVDRRKPGLVELRVLRRLSYTEADADAQFDKLLSAFDVADWSEPLFNNRALFSDYYLNKRLREMPEWEEPPQTACHRIREVFAAFRRGTAEKGGTSTQADLVERVLSALGFAVEPEPVGSGGGAGPGYKLYIPGVGSNASKPVAICLGYPWGRYLDGKDEVRDPWTPKENPSAPIVRLLQEGEVSWAILSNGKLWRLYSARAHARSTNYYEVDLEETLALADPNEAFRYFWLFFRVDAFAPSLAVRQGVRRQSCFLDRLLDESEAYAKELGERLKDRIFDETFRHFAEGFIHYIRTREGRGADLSHEALAQIFPGTLTFLYRLLFLLYAEARDLLPARQVRGYLERSISALKGEVAQAGGKIEDEAPGKLTEAFRLESTALYDRLLRLFRTIDRGDPAVNVPEYNGGLFITEVRPEDTSPESRSAKFLLENKIPDRLLALGLDRIARDADPKTGELVFVDYKSLGVRQLGSIYEGLLEFRLRVAAEKMAFVKGKKTEEIVPYVEAIREKRTILKQGKGKAAQERTLSRGAVYLENDRRERKATGSYYTPDFIVEHIVEKTVGPVLAEKLERLRPRLREAQQEYRAAESRNKELVRAGLKPEDPSKVLRKHLGLLDDILDVRVADPAMGSGHFLVGAVDFITDRLIGDRDGFLQAFPWNPVTARLEETRATILAELSRQGVDIDERRLTDVNLLKRHVLKRCIYGVDINPMAVELAKVSLWLDCFTLGAPLSFLDHHLRCGNSIIGAHDVGAHILPTAPRYGDFTRAVGNLLTISELADATAGEVRRSRPLHDEARRYLEPFRRKVNVQVARSFLAASLEDILHAEHLADALDISGFEQSRFGKLFQRAQEVAEAESFFHWDLEFPEVTFGPRPGTTQVFERRSDGGFDVVVGNPPWIRQEALSRHKPYYKEAFPRCFDGSVDIYVLFLERGIQILRPGGRLGMVVPNKWLKAGYGEPLRRFLVSDARPASLVDFGHAPVFPDADTFPCILAAERRPRRTENPTEDLAVTQVPRDLLPELYLPEHVSAHTFPVPLRRLAPEGWNLEPPAVRELLDRLRARGIPLKDYAGSAPLYGVKTGFNEAFLIDQATRDRLVAEDPKCEPIIKPFLRGRDITRWIPEWGGEWLILLKSSENEDWPWADKGTKASDVFKRAYAALWSHFKAFESKLRKRQDQGRHWWELRSCDYYASFDRPKIVWQEIAFHSQFGLDTGGRFLNNKAFLLSSEDHRLLATLNSTLLWWYMWRVLPHMKDEALAMQGFLVEELPIVDAGSTVGAQLIGRAGALIEQTAARREGCAEFLGLLRRTVRVQEMPPGLESFWTLDEAGLSKELMKARVQGIGKVLPPKMVSAFLEAKATIRKSLQASLTLEREIQDLVFQAYALTPEEIKLVKETSPPRDPVTVLEAAVDECQ